MDQFPSGTPQIGPRCDSHVAGLTAFGDQWDPRLDAPIILVVEDDWILRQAIVDELSAAGWETREAESGETALEILEGGEPVDLLVTDISLGGSVDGWQVANACRKQDSDFPVIYVSANIERDPRRVEGSVFLSKPCVMSKLVEVCRRLAAGR